MYDLNSEQYREFIKLELKYVLCVLFWYHSLSLSRFNVVGFIIIGFQQWSLKNVMLYNCMGIDLFEWTDKYMYNSGVY